MSDANFDKQLNTTVSVYTRHRVPNPACGWEMTNPEEINTIVVYKKPDPHLWDRVSKWFIFFNMLNFIIYLN